ncbi:MAG: hypothetical protein L3J92_06465 [Thermoplasmata archaeon]|nr:hypothetical protein [Thermoplasmata archaeon]
MSSAPPRRRRSVPPQDPGPPHRSNAAIPVAVVVVGLGIYLARFSLLAPALFGLLLLYAGASFLSTRINPLSAHFYLTSKPSWTAVLVVFVGSFALFGAAYALYLDHFAPLLPRF